MPSSALPASVYSIQFSKSSNRSAPLALAGKTVSGNIYVFTKPDSGVRQVRISLDGRVARTESVAPFDLVGGDSANAKPLDTRTLTNGQHIVRAAVDKVAGGTDQLTATFTVANPVVGDTTPPAVPRTLTASGSTTGIALKWAANTEPDLAGYNVFRSTAATGSYVKLNAALLNSPAFNDANAPQGATSFYEVRAVDTTGNQSGGAKASATRPVGYGLLYSTSSNRSAPASLAGTTVSGNVYIFTKPDTGVVRVRFYLDDPGRTGAPFSTEGVAPYDMKGGTATTAVPFDTSTLAEGEHTVAAAIDKSAGGTEVVEARFTVANAGPFSWKTVAPAPLARFEARGAEVGGKLYVFGGFIGSTCCNATSRSDVYDPATNTWAQLADMPKPITHPAVEVVGSTIYFIGGYLGNGLALADVWKYDVSSNTWSSGPSLPQPRGAGASGRLGNTLHFFGGIDRGYVGERDRGDHFVLSLSGGTSWQTLAAMPNARNHLAGAALGGKLYAIGGQHLYNEVSGNDDEVDVYDPAADAWSEVESLPAARGHVSAAVLDGRIIVFGGTLTGNQRSADVTAYDSAKDVWLKLPSLPEARKSPVVAAVGDTLIVTTGEGVGWASSTTWIGKLSGTWELGAPAPVALGEVAGGIVGRVLYLVGEGATNTLAYDLSRGTWSTFAARPFVADHHAAEVVGGKLYLLGGMGTAAGKVQIYDPVANSWSLGANMPFAAGSSSSAVIGGKIYVAGGIVGTSTTGHAARYDPVIDAWTTVAPMKQPRNHAASATDGLRLFVFGGRGPGSGDGNTVANGFSTVQIYNPVSNSWSSSDDEGAALAPLPQARGGMGKAVYRSGAFYVVGGETSTGAGATPAGTYSRVDVLDPTGTWRLGRPMPTARHGIFPLEIGGRIYVAGGGTQAGSSKSSVLEILNIGP